MTKIQNLSNLLGFIHGMDSQKKMTTNEISCFLIVANNPGWTLGEVGVATHLNHASISRVMQMLCNPGRGEKSGYGLLETYADKKDGRIKRVRLTRRGQSLADKLERLAS